jgi:hypothetical protein
VTGPAVPTTVLDRAETRNVAIETNHIEGARECNRLISTSTHFLVVLTVAQSTPRADSDCDPLKKLSIGLTVMATKRAIVAAICSKRACED